MTATTTTTITAITSMHLINPSSQFTLPTHSSPAHPSPSHSSLSHPLTPSRAQPTHPQRDVHHKVSDFEDHMDTGSVAQFPLHCFPCTHTTPPAHFYKAYSFFSSTILSPCSYFFHTFSLTRTFSLPSFLSPSPHLSLPLSLHLSVPSFLPPLPSSLPPSLPPSDASTCHSGCFDQRSNSLRFSQSIHRLRV